MYKQLKSELFEGISENIFNIHTYLLFHIKQNYVQKIRHMSYC